MNIFNLNKITRKFGNNNAIHFINVIYADGNFFVVNYVNPI